jgi:general secretion pathway protein K
LLLVRGITPEIFHGGLKDMVSVYQDKETGPVSDIQRRTGFDFNKINVNAASPRMLRALPGITEDIVQAVVKYREKKDFRSMTDLHLLVGSEVFSTISPYLMVSLSPYYTIKSVGMLKEGKTRQGVHAVVKIDRSLKKGYDVIQWIDGLEHGS